MYSAESIRADKRQRQIEADRGWEPSSEEVVFGDYLRGKRVIVVGPAGYLEGSARGPWIDSHDVVIRLNWGVPVPDGKQADYGTRTDVLYKRLLKLGILDHIDVDEFEAAGVQWIVAAVGGEKLGNRHHLEQMVGDRIPYFMETKTRGELRGAMGNNPLVGMMAIAHLLKFDLASLTVTGCDFYASGYHAGYGGRAYRESLNHKEGVISPRHDAVVQLRYLDRMRQRDPRLLFDDVLTSIVMEAVKDEVSRDVVAVIPARYESSRFPGKPLALINGKPMILHVCERVAQAVASIIVATDDPRIAQCVEAAGYRALMTGQHATGTDRVAEVARHIHAEVYVNVQGDEPLVEPADVVALVREKRKHPKAIINGICELTGDPYDTTTVKAAVTNDGVMVYASRGPVPATKSGHAAQWKQLGMYAFSRAELLGFGAMDRGVLEQSEDVEMLRFIENGRQIRTVVVSPSQAVDLPEHIGIVESLMREAVPA